MSADQSTTPPTQEPRLCKMGCGFFGSGASDDCCSKCFLEMQKKNGCSPVSAPVPQRSESPTELPAAPEPMDVDPSPTVEVPVPPSPVATAAAAPIKKKKKKSYKAMMAAMTHSEKPRDADQEKDSIRKATGGGNFSKIEKI